MKKKILLVEDDANLRSALYDTLILNGYEVTQAEDGQQALLTLQHSSIDLILSDVQMQPMDGFELLHNLQQRNNPVPVVLMTAYGTIEKAVEAIRNGATDYLVKPFETDELINMLDRLLPDAPVATVSDGLVAVDKNIIKLKALVKRVAESEATVLLNGESGVGKEVFAQYIHHHSSRSEGPFVAINCAAIPENMLESVLFGYEKGSFTGAVQSHAGKFEQAQNGTLLLDEVSEMDISLQAKLLRVLQEKEVERIGSKKTVSLNVRVLATTNRNLREEVTAGRFREDLFYRLNVFPITIPSLRDRRDDIVPIAMQLLDRHIAQNRHNIRFDKMAERKLLQHSWPGNVRELDNTIQRALILKNDDLILAEDIQYEMVTHSFSAQQNPPYAVQDESVLVSDLKDREQQLILDALHAGDGSRKYAAEKLGISPRTLRYKLARMRDNGVAIPG
ncbi:MAG: sigma-54 dependent transcriptional regulator [Gammaproteobacteria bacterium]|nr:sigma-54 dependent transcriptional regulator [Gammaproteobacteria bacterium]